MIKYTLKCENGHAFESWFASGDAYDSLHRAGHVSCAVCGSQNVNKAIMAPGVSTSSERAPSTEAATQEVPQSDDAQAALAQMREDVEKNATYVGGEFARKARDMHLGDVPETPIWGEANLKDAKALIDDGVPVAPLPFIPTRKVN